MENVPEYEKHILIDVTEVDLHWIDRIDALFRMPNFGVGAASLKTAASMIVRDMWLAGDLTSESLGDDFDGDENSAELITAFKDTHDLFIERLRLSVQRGHLETVLNTRDFDDNIDPSRTYVDCHELIRWLGERGYSAGSVVDDWMDDEEKISYKLCEESLFLRTANQDPRNMSFLSRSHVKDDEEDVEKVRTAYKSALIENQVLKEKLEYFTRQPMKQDGDMNPKSRNTLLTLIGALCEEFKVSMDDRKFAPKIIEILERRGVKADPKTYRKLPSEINEALARRKS